MSWSAWTKHTETVLATHLEKHADWIVEELRKGRQMRRPTIVQERHCSDAIVKRVLNRLADEEKIIFKGPSRTGTYMLLGK